jgi:outer membrane protein assembly factor BamB
MRSLLGLVVVLTALSPLLAADWPEFRGPDRTGHSKETGLLEKWPEEGPKLLWKTDKAGKGYAGMAIVGGTVYTMGARDKDEYAIAFDSKGNEKWATKIGPVLIDKGVNTYTFGPAATPTVDGDRIFCLSSKGMLVCLNKEGKEQWKIDLPKDMGGVVDDQAGGAETFGWSYTWSPIVDGDQLLIVPGGPRGTLAAVDKKKGTLLWRSKDVTEVATMVTPALATIGGVKQLVYTYLKGVVGVSAKDGSLLWKYEREDPWGDVVCSSPLVQGDMVYATALKGGCVGLKIGKNGEKFTATVVYTEPVIANYHSGVVLVGKHVYGHHEDRNWTCQEVETGKVAWPKKTTRQAIKAGGIVVAEGRLYTLDDKGTVAMLEASPKQFKLISSFKLPALADKERPKGGKVYTYPALSDGKLYVRDFGLLYCYQVK